MWFVGRIVPSAVNVEGAASILVLDIGIYEFGRFFDQTLRQIAVFGFKLLAESIDKIEPRSAALRH